MPEIPRGHQWSQEGVRGRQRSLEVTKDHQRLLEGPYADESG